MKNSVFKHGIFIKILVDIGTYLTIFRHIPDKKLVVSGVAS